jgi:hypothetical protein
MTQIEGRSESVTIWLHGDDLKPAEVSRRLGVRPSKCWIKGDVHVTKTGAEVIRKTGMWKIVPPDRTVPPAVQAYELLKLLDGHDNLFQMFPGLQFAKLSIFTAVLADESGGGDIDVSLDETTIAMAAALGLQVDFSFHVIGP